LTGHDIIVVGASAGGVGALKEIVRGLPQDLPVAVFVVIHIPTEGTSLLPCILNRAGSLPAVHPVDGEGIQHGRIYIAPNNRHLLLTRGYIPSGQGPRENKVRPAVDPLFRTAARAYGPRVVGVVLTGNLDDGAAGLLAVKKRGGIAVVQDPDSALFPGMPQSALKYVDVDYCLPLADIPPLLVSLARQPVKEEASPIFKEMGVESKIAGLDMSANEEKMGTPSVFSCPECQGTLWELCDGDLTRFRCRVGHAFSIERRLADQARQRNHK